ncbi:response regulator [Capillibacterium thermochitinicola]|uniref:Response regulator n=1 Tax=Capillibacterium thermochitinicola TaxID=2699427 RepID=A0A8J6HY60_9FIRM|nr:response regulator [Capillibacterium thermochitinicola]MBA2132030.1 response regulator [Capillibacterium thermochitinicola]
MNLDRVLIAESDPHLAELMVIRLSNAGYQLATCTQGNEVLTKALDFKPGVVIVDQYLTDKDGLEVCYELRLHSATRNIGIILLTQEEINLADLVGLGVRIDTQLIKPFKPKDILTEVNTLMAERRATTKNSLTGFPGWDAIRREIAERITAGVDCDLLFIDINNFRIYNQCYGFSAGDEALRLLCRLLLEVTDELDSPDIFISHIHGDDFAVMLPVGTGEQVGRALIDRFDQEVLQLYLEDDRERGGMYLQRPDGRLEQWPLMSLSVALINGIIDKYRHPLETKTVGEELLKRLKVRPGSNLLRDRSSNSPA